MRFLRKFKHRFKIVLLIHFFLIGCVVILNGCTEVNNEDPTPPAQQQADGDSSEPQQAGDALSEPQPAEVTSAGAEAESNPLPPLVHEDSIEQQNIGINTVTDVAVNAAIENIPISCLG